MEKSKEYKNKEMKSEGKERRKDRKKNLYKTGKC